MSTLASFDVDPAPHAIEELISVRKLAHQRLEERVVSAREEERRRIAGELTEQPLQAMRAVRARLQELDREMQTSRHDEWELLRLDVDEICWTLERLIADLRRPWQPSGRGASGLAQLPAATRAPGSAVDPR